MPSISRETIDLLAKAFATAVVEAFAEAGIELESGLPPIPPEMLARAGMPAARGGFIEIGRYIETGQPVEVAMTDVGVDPRTGDLVTIIEVDGNEFDSRIDTDDAGRRFEHDNATLRGFGIELVETASA